MTQATFSDFTALGNAVKSYVTAISNYRAVLESRKEIAHSLHTRYPNMTLEAVTGRMWEQEREFEKKADDAYSILRTYAISVGWNLEHTTAFEEVKGIMRKELTPLSEIEI